MTEKDLDIAIEKCERIMEFDTRTMQNPVSENGWIFDKVYDLLKFLRRIQLETGAKVDGNLIDRQAAVDSWDGMTSIGRQKRIEKYVNALPPARVERKKGKWVNCYTDGYRNMCKCSECGARIDIQEEFKSFFCYHCGARMDGDDNG